MAGTLLSPLTTASDGIVSLGQRLPSIIAIFGAGVGNFAMHRAFMESDDPLIQQMVRPLADKVGPNITYVFEFLLLVGAGMMLPGAKMPMLFILLLYLLHTMGELCLSPVGLAAMSRLSPPHMLGLMMGTWFLATAGGNFMSGVIAAAIGASAEADQASTVLAAYGRIGGLAMLIGLAVLALSPWIGRLMKQGGR